MPPYAMITKDHMKFVLAGKKKLMLMEDVRFVNVPTFDEVSVKQMYKDVVSQEDVAAYFPDKYPKGMQCNRAYMFNIWNTLYPDQVKKVIQHANE